MTTSVSDALGTTSSYTTATKNSGTTQKDEFLKLLTYQLKSQNPMKPYDNQEFASQLAQFSQLEQMIDIRSLIEEQLQANQILTNTMANSALPGMLGKDAKVLTNNIKFDGENSASIGYNLPYPAATGKLNIMDSSGKTVRTIDLSSSELNTGDHDYEWDGLDNNGNKLSEGNYKFNVNAYDSTGMAITADTYSTGKIQAVRFKSEGTLLVVNGVEVSLANVTDISTDN
ncbi:MAG: flagellar basal-body rod modification protein FlgD [Bacteroidota bacterium]|nr:flagellar basal-body rod modification protein FlgD [Bacteroidota bacterium]